MQYELRQSSYTGFPVTPSTEKHTAVRTAEFWCLLDPSVYWGHIDVGQNALADLCERKAGGLTSASWAAPIGGEIL